MAELGRLAPLPSQVLQPAPHRHKLVFKMRPKSCACVHKNYVAVCVLLGLSVLYRKSLPQFRIPLLASLMRSQSISQCSDILHCWRWASLYTWVERGTVIAQEHNTLSTTDRRTFPDPPTLVKENLEILQKIVKLYFPRSNPFSIEGTRHQPHSQGLLPFQNGGQTRRKTIKFIEHKRKSQLGTKK